MIRREFVRFVFAGLVNTALTYCLYLVLLGPIGYMYAYSAAFAAGILLAYFLNVRYVFQTQVGVASFAKFPVVYAVQYLLGAGVLWVCIEWLGVAREIGLAFSIAVTVPVTFIASRIALKGSARVPVK